MIEPTAFPDSEHVIAFTSALNCYSETREFFFLIIGTSYFLNSSRTLRLRSFPSILRRSATSSSVKSLRADSFILAEFLSLLSPRFKKTSWQIRQPSFLFFVFSAAESRHCFQSSPARRIMPKPPDAKGASTQRRVTPPLHRRPSRPNDRSIGPGRI